MSYNPSLITYAVSLHFTEDVNDIISAATKEIANLTGNTFMLDNKVPPHITIGAFHAAKEDEAKLLQTVDEFSKTQSTGTIRFTAPGDFNRKVLFLKPQKDDYLTNINRALHNVMLSQFKEGENGYYLPDIWFAHTTLATRLNSTQFSSALEIARKINLPLETKACDIGVYLCSPFKELKRFSLAGYDKNLKMNYRLGTNSDLDDIVSMVDSAKALMSSQGIEQWDEVYPCRNDFESDIKSSTLYIATEDDRLVAVYVLSEECDAEYFECKWENKKPCILHRFCVSPEFQHKGIGKKVLLHIEQQILEMGYDSVRLDAFTENPFSLSLYKKNGYVERGYADWRKGRFVLMEKRLKK